MEPRYADKSPFPTRVIIARTPSLSERPPGLESAVAREVAKAQDYFYAGQVVGYGGDHVLVDVSGLGMHQFSRETGLWREGPCLNLADASLWGDSFHAFVSPREMAPVLADQAPCLGALGIATGAQRPPGYR